VARPRLERRGLALRSRSILAGRFWLRIAGRSIGTWKSGLRSLRPTESPLLSKEGSGVVCRNRFQIFLSTPPVLSNPFPIGVSISSIRMSHLRFRSTRNMPTRRLRRFSNERMCRLWSAVQGYTFARFLTGQTLRARRARGDCSAGPRRRSRD
jgi:hypothetical protein